MFSRVGNIWKGARADRQILFGVKKFHFDPDELNDGNGKMFMLDEPNFSTLTQTLSFEENSAKEWVMARQRAPILSSYVHFE